MQINNLSSYNICQPTNNIRKAPVTSTPGVSFCGNVKTDTVNFAFTKGLKKLKNFSIEEYKTLTQEEINAIRDEYKNLKCADDNYIQRCEQIHGKAAESIRTTLNKMYGEGNYKVITIGRSLSSIGKVLGYQIGEENVINIPMSSAGRFLNKEYVRNMEADGDIEILQEWLAKHGLNREGITNSGKQYVIMDFCLSGASLRGAEKLLTRSDLLGDKNIKAMDIKDCIKDKKFAASLHNELTFCNYKHFSFVDTCYSVPEMDSAMINTEKADIVQKLMWFKLLDNEMRPPESVSKGFSKIPVIGKIMDFFRQN